MQDHTTPRVLCKCGCGNDVPIATAPSQQQKYISGHHPAARRPLAVRFWEKVDKRDPDECWEWQGGFHRGGYGQIKIRSHKSGQAHRVSYELHYGPIPDGLIVCHKCDHPACVNPHHLFLGTHRDNIDDKLSKNRQPRGEQCHQAILTEADVLEIRRLHKEGISQRAIALRFGTNFRNVFNIVHRNSWKHVKE